MKPSFFLKDCHSHRIKYKYIHVYTGWINVYSWWYGTYNGFAYTIGQCCTTSYCNTGPTKTTTTTKSSATYKTISYVTLPFFLLTNYIYEI